MNPEQPIGFGFFRDRPHGWAETLVLLDDKRHHLNTGMRGFNHAQS